MGKITKFSLCFILIGIALTVANSNSLTQIPFKTAPANGYDNSNSSTQISFKKPASDWHESLPLGNGRLGSMILGDTLHERIVLNEQSLWSGGEQDANRPDAYIYLPETQKLLLESKNHAAQDLLQKNFTCVGTGSTNGSKEHFGCYETLNDFLVKKGSLALKMGFVNFPVDQFGVQKLLLKRIAKKPELQEAHINY